MQIRWGRILLVVALIVAAAYSRQIGVLLAELALGSLWRDFCWEIQRMPRLGRYTIVLLVLMLIFIALYMLGLNAVRKGGKP